MDDTISRQAAIEIIQSMYPGMPRVPWMRKDWQKRYEPYIRTENAIRDLPPAQLEREIPIKPIETTDRAWGIPNRQAVCPKCDYYLGHVAFLGDYKGKRITYCETCGQAIDWEGWDFDE